MKNITLSFLALLPFFLLSCQSETSTGNTPEEIALEEKIGQMLLVGFRGMSVDADSRIVRQIEAGRVGGIILFDYDVINQEFKRNIESPEQVETLIDSLQAHAPSPLWISIDQEGGRVLRLKPRYGFPGIPSQQYLGELDDLDSTRYYANLNARNLAELGFNLNFAPVVDLALEKESGVIGHYERSFSADPAQVVRHAEAVVEAHLEAGVTTVLKHFPGHGSARGDSHMGMTDVTDTWQSIELTPYRRLIEDGYEGAIMTAHVFNRQIDEEYPATLSEKAMNILRDSMAYDGVIFSDDMHMQAITSEYGLEEAIIQSIIAGVDVFCFGNNLGYDEEIPEKFQSIVQRAIEEGKIAPDRINASYERIRKLKGKLK